MLDDNKFVIVQLTGARLLWRDVGAILSEQSLQTMSRILAEQTAYRGDHLLTVAMVGGTLNIDGAYDEALRSLEMLVQGVSEV